MIKRILIILLVVLESLVGKPSPGTIYTDYEDNINNNNIYESSVINEDDESTLNSLRQFRLNQKLELKCDTIHLKEQFTFKNILFNRSLVDLGSLLAQNKLRDQYDYNLVDEDTIQIKSEIALDVLFSNVVYSLQANELIISHARYADSGHYYCVYVDNVNKQYLVKSFLLVVFDEETLRTNLNDIVQLSPCTEDKSESNNIEWKINDEPINTHNKTLSIKMSQLSMFDSIYRCQNVETGAYKLFYIECLNREYMYPEPLVSPSRQNVAIGSQTLITCDKSNKESREPDRYQWFMDPSPDETSELSTASGNKIVSVFNLDLRKTIGNGAILELKNLTQNQSGWYICCLFYSKERIIKKRTVLDYYENSNDDSIDELTFEANHERLKNSFEHSCSSAALNVQDPSTLNTLQQQQQLNSLFIPKVLSTKTKVLIGLIILVSCLILIVAVCFLIYYGYSKYFTYLKTVKAAQTMHQNDFYESSSQDPSNRPGSSFNPDSKLDHFKQILTTSSSIESLLNKDDIKRWRIPIKDLTFGHIIGRGAFGVVFYAELKKKQTISLSAHSIKQHQHHNRCTDTDSGLDSEAYLANNNNNSGCYNGSSSVAVTKNMSVAVKKLPENATSENFLDLFKELNLMFQVGQHTHIINLIGYSIEESSLYIITDYARYGNLKDFLRKHRESTTPGLTSAIGPATLLLYSYQIALGMQYLHSKKVLHRDLAARNILVDEYDSIKIADFGLARNIRTDYYYVQQREGKMPLKWMSPEALSFNRISNESDIWSYGVLMWEIYTYGQTPYPTIQAENILANLNSGYRMEKPTDCDQFIYDEIILNCWRIEPKKRPTFSQLVDFYQQSTYLNSTQQQQQQTLNTVVQNFNLIPTQLNSTTADQTSQSTKLTNVDQSSESNFSSEPNNTLNVNEEAVNSSSNFLSTSSSSSSSSSSSNSSSYNPTSTSSSTSSVSSPTAHVCDISACSIFYDDHLLSDKLLEKKDASSPAMTTSVNLHHNEETKKLISKDNNNNTATSKSIRIKTPKTSTLRKFAYRTTDRKNSLGFSKHLTSGGSSSSNSSNNAKLDDDDEYDDQNDEDDFDEKKLFHKYNLLSEKSNFLNKNILSKNSNNNSISNSNFNKHSNSSEPSKKKFLLTYV